VASCTAVCRQSFIRCRRKSYSQLGFRRSRGHARSSVPLPDQSCFFCNGLRHGRLHDAPSDAKSNTRKLRLMGSKEARFPLHSLSQFVDEGRISSSAVVQVDDTGEAIPLSGLLSRYRTLAQLRELCDAAAVTRLLLNKPGGYGGRRRSPARYADSEACALRRSSTASLFFSAGQ
jgi:hypothetical protein